MEVSQLREDWQIVLYGECPYCRAIEYFYTWCKSFRNTDILRCTKCLRDFNVNVKLEPNIEVYKLQKVE
jgi:hypothetical protein